MTGQGRCWRDGLSFIKKQYKNCRKFSERSLEYTYSNFKAFLVIFKLKLLKKENSLFVQWRHNEMPKNAIFTLKLSLATMIFKISVFKSYLVKIAMLPKIRPKCTWMSHFGFRLLRGSLSKNRPLNFAWPIILPETLASEKFYREDNSNSVALIHNNFLAELGETEYFVPPRPVCTSRNRNFGIFCSVVKCFIFTICQCILHLFIGKRL